MRRVGQWLDMSKALSRRTNRAVGWAFYFRSACIAVVCIFILAAKNAAALPAAPDAFVRQMTDEVTAAIRQDSAIRAGDASRIATLVETKIVPHFDFPRITQIAMGVNWRRATPAQQQQLTQQFKQLLVRTYSGALASYRDQVIEVKPLRATPDDTEVTVRSVVKQAGSEPIAIEYDLERTESGWKVFDVRLAGMSLVATYRSAFAEEVRNRGIDGLIDLLTSKNRLIGTKSATPSSPEEPS
jgi:phospholipid transport system substrate-binding protein